LQQALTSNFGRLLQQTLTSNTILSSKLSLHRFGNYGNRQWYFERSNTNKGKGFNLNLNGNISKKLGHRKICNILENLGHRKIKLDH